MAMRTWLWLALLVTLPAEATKPCPDSPCQTAQSFDQAKCQAAATWIAVGKIVKVVDHQTGEPLFKNFAEFTFVIERWEKAKPKTDAPRELRFRVGWCNNRQQLPDKDQRGGLFRFYGGGAVNAAEPQYLWFEPL